uniref:PH domain-containing protein n=1 Tax=Arcella intermedia TaxID=1963864 RepID=A0A6B2L068_9EUKA
MTSQELCTAAFKGDLNSVKRLLSILDNNQVNGTNDRGQTALYCAAREGRTDVVRELLSRSVDINVQEKKGSTPLHGASFGGHAQALSLLLSARASVSITNHPAPSQTVGATAHQEAQGEAREVWKLWKEGGVEALKRKNYPIFERPNRNTKPTRVKRDDNRDNSESESMSLKVKLGRRSSLLQRTLRDGPVLVKNKESWRERGLIVFKEFSLGFALYKPDLKDPGKERILEKYYIDTSDHHSSPFGIASTNDPESSTTTFYIRCKLTDGSLVERLFKTKTLEERTAWLTFLYNTMSETGGKNIDLSTVEKEEYVRNWKNYAKEGYFVPGHYIPPSKTREDELQALVNSIEEITKEDIYYTCLQELSVPTMLLHRSNPLREILIKILKVPRPNDMCNWMATGEAVFQPIRDFRELIAKAKSYPDSESFKKVLEKLDDFYRQYLNFKGSIPKPSILRSGIEKIGSRIITPDVAQIISDPNRNTAEGIHRVVRIGNVFLKINPSAPAYEMAVGELSELIWQQGTAITIIVKIVLPNGEYVCQAAAAVEGLLLRDFIKELPDLVPYLDEENLSMQYLCGTLYRPNDGKLETRPGSIFR